MNIDEARHTVAQMPVRKIGGMKLKRVRKQYQAVKEEMESAARHVRKRDRYIATPSPYSGRLCQHVVPSPEALADRDRRAAYVGTLTEEICRDPRPGQSALDRKIKCQLQNARLSP